MYFHYNNGYMNAPKYYVYTYTACLANCQTQRYIMSTLTLEGLVEICQKTEAALSSETTETLMTLHGIKTRKTFAWREHIFNHAITEIKRS